MPLSELRLPIRSVTADLLADAIETLQRGQDVLLNEAIDDKRARTMAILQNKCVLGRLEYIKAGYEQPPFSKD